MEHPKMGENIETNVCSHNGEKQGGNRWKCLISALLWVLLFLGMQLVVSGVITAILTISTIREIGFLPGIEELVMTAYRVAAERAVAITAAADAMTLITAGLIFFARGKPPLRELGYLDRPKGSVLYLIPLGIGLNLAVSILFGLLPAEWLAAYQESAEAVSGGVDPLSILAVAVLAPFAEETVFRGLCYGRLKRVLPRAAAAIVQALLFGLMHGNVLWVCYTFLIGLILAMVRDKHESLLAPILLHMAFNGASYLFLLFV